MKELLIGILVLLGIVSLKKDDENTTDDNNIISPNPNPGSSDNQTDTGDGVNLVKNPIVNQTATKNWIGQREVHLVAGKEYTFSAIAYCSEKLVSQGQRVSIDVFWPDYSFFKSLHFESTTQEIKSITFIAPKTGTYTILSYLEKINYANTTDRYSIVNSGASGAGTVLWYKMEKGKTFTGFEIPEPNYNLITSAIVNETATKNWIGKREVYLLAGSEYTFAASAYCSEKLASQGQRVSVDLFWSDYSFFRSLHFQSTSEDVQHVTFVAPYTGTYTIMSYLEKINYANTTDRYSIVNAGNSGSGTVLWYKMEDGNSYTGWGLPEDEIVQTAEKELYKGDKAKPYDSFYDYSDDYSQSYLGYMGPNQFILPVDRANCMRWRIVPSTFSVSYANNLSVGYPFPNSGNKANFTDFFYYAFSFRIEIFNPFPFDTYITIKGIDSVSLCYNQMAIFNTELYWRNSAAGVRQNLSSKSAQNFYISRYLSLPSAYFIDFSVPYYRGFEEPVQLQVNQGSNYFDLQFGGREPGDGFISKNNAGKIEIDKDNAMVDFALKFTEGDSSQIYKSEFGLYSGTTPGLQIEKSWTKQYTENWSTVFKQNLLKF